MIVREYFYSLRRTGLLLAVILLVITLASFVFIIMNTTNPVLQSLRYRYIPFIISFVAGYISVFLFQRKLENQSGVNLFSQLSHYRQAYHLRSAITAFTGVFACVTGVLTSDWIAILPSVIGIIFIVTNLPHPEKCILELSVDTGDAALIRNPESQINP